MLNLGGKTPNIIFIKLIFTELEIIEIYIVCNLQWRKKGISLGDGKKTRFQNNRMDSYTESLIIKVHPALLNECNCLLNFKKKFNG